MGHEAESAGDGLSWTVWPLKQQPLKGFGIGLLVVGFSAYCLQAFGHWLYAAASFVILSIGVHSSLLPATYSVDSEGVHLKQLLSRRTLPWSDLACYLSTDDFLALSVADPPSHRSISAGMIVRFCANREEVEAAISAHLPRCPSALDE